MSVDGDSHAESPVLSIAAIRGPPGSPFAGGIGPFANAAHWQARWARLSGRRIEANFRAFRNRREIASGDEALGRADAIWQSVLWFFLEGFALYGASLHWVATTAVMAIASEVDTQQRQKPARSERQKSISFVSPSARPEITVFEREDAIDRTAFRAGMPSTRDGFASPARNVDRHRFVHPGWLAMIWRAIASRWAKWRREWEIKEAVATLAEFDNRTLRDMGILDRSGIEQAVRYGRDWLM